jgi:hypothetical protein
LVSVCVGGGLLLLWLYSGGGVSPADTGLPHGAGEQADPPDPELAESVVAVEREEASRADQPRSSGSPAGTAEQDKELGYFVQDLRQRFGLLAGQRAGLVIEHLSSEFSILHPGACRLLASNPDVPVGELLPPPGEARLLELVSQAEAARIVLLNRNLYDLEERVRGYGTLQLEVWRGRSSHVSIAEHLASFEPYLTQMFTRSNEVRALFAEYAEAVIEDLNGLDSSDPEAIETRLHALFWEARCRKEDELIAGLPAEERFWFHLGRVMTRHVYDDTYWIAPDELAAAEQGFPDWLPPR